MILTPATSSRILRAVRRANLAADRIYRHRRALYLHNLSEAHDLAGAERIQRLIDRAERDYAAAQQAMKFPWEV